MHSKIKQYLHDKNGLSGWKAIHPLIDLIINQKPKHIRIPDLIGGLYGYPEDTMVPVSACLTLVFTSIIVVDDLLDGDGRFLDLGLTEAELANISTALIAAAFNLIHDFPIADTDKIKVNSILSAMLFDVSHGQALDVVNQLSESRYWEVARLKSGAFFSGAFGLGAVASSVDEKDFQILTRLGHEYGILIQIHDDLRDALAVPANQDWQNGRYPLPILYAETVPHPARERFSAIRSQVNQPRLLAEAQEILLRCGAISYGIYQIEKYDANARQLIEKLGVSGAAGLIKLFDELIHPVKALLAKFEHAT